MIVIKTLLQRKEGLGSKEVSVALSDDTHDAVPVRFLEPEDRTKDTRVHLSVTEESGTLIHTEHGERQREDVGTDRMFLHVCFGKDTIIIAQNSFFCNVR
jgi:hypothetical protein